MIQTETHETTLRRLTQDVVASTLAACTIHSTNSTSTTQRHLTRVKTHHRYLLPPAFAVQMGPQCHPLALDRAFRGIPRHHVSLHPSCPSDVWQAVQILLRLSQLRVSLGLSQTKRSRRRSGEAPTVAARASVMAFRGTTASRRPPSVAASSPTTRSCRRVRGASTTMTLPPRIIIPCNTGLYRACRVITCRCKVWVTTAGRQSCA